MAFTTTQKLTIVRLLGWPANSINPSSIYYNNVLNSRLLVIMEEAETEAMTLVDRITALDGKLETAIDSTGIKKIDDIEFFGSNESGTKLDALRGERKRLIKELSLLLDIPMQSNSGMGSICI